MLSSPRTHPMVAFFVLLSCSCGGGSATPQQDAQFSAQEERSPSLLKAGQQSPAAAGKPNEEKKVDDNKGLGVPDYKLISDPDFKVIEVDSPKQFWAVLLPDSAEFGGHDDQWYYAVENQQGLRGARVWKINKETVDTTWLNDIRRAKAKRGGELAQLGMYGPMIMSQATTKEYAEWVKKTKRVFVYEEDPVSGKEVKNRPVLAEKSRPHAPNGKTKKEVKVSSNEDTASPRIVSRLGFNFAEVETIREEMLPKRIQAILMRDSCDYLGHDAEWYFAGERLEDNVNYGMVWKIRKSTVDGKWMKDLVDKKTKRMAELDEARRYHPIKPRMATTKEYQAWFKKAKPVFQSD